MKWPLDKSSDASRYQHCYQNTHFFFLNRARKSEDPFYEKEMKVFVFAEMTSVTYRDR